MLFRTRRLRMFTPPSLADLLDVPPTRVIVLPVKLRRMLDPFLSTLSPHRLPTRRDPLEMRFPEPPRAVLSLVRHFKVLFRTLPPKPRRTRFKPLYDRTPASHFFLQGARDLEKLFRTDETADLRTLSDRLRIKLPRLRGVLYRFRKLKMP